VLLVRVDTASEGTGQGEGGAPAVCAGRRPLRGWCPASPNSRAAVQASRPVDETAKSK
jgi:hypothetical protein